MTKLTLEALQTLDAVDRGGSFSAAAELLHKVPSTVSYTVAKLEEQLGVAVFERFGSRVKLTVAGTELLKEGRALLVAAGDLEARVRRIATGYEPELRLVHDSLIQTSALIGLLEAFEQVQCGTSMRITTEVMTGTWEALREGRADLVLAVGDGPASGEFATVALGTVRYAFCVAPLHPLARMASPIGRDALLRYPAIVVADTARVLPARTVGLLSGQSRITVPDIASKLALQLAGLGHGFLPMSLIGQLQRQRALVALEVEEPKPDETLWLAWRRGAEGEALKWWRTRLREWPLLPER